MVSCLKVTIDASIAFQYSTEYHQILGSLQYLTFTRLDITFSINKVCLFKHLKHKTGQWSKEFHYIVGTTTYDICLSSTSDNFVKGFTGADWRFDPADHKSTSSYCISFEKILSHGHHQRNRHLYLELILELNIEALLMCYLCYFYHLL